MDVPLTVRPADVAGLRLGEARQLTLPDVDPRAGVLTIRGAKFGKSRLIPRHDSTRRVLAEYVARRARHFVAAHVKPLITESSP